MVATKALTGNREAIAVQGGGFDLKVQRERATPQIVERRMLRPCHATVEARARHGALGATIAAAILPIHGHDIGPVRRIHPDERLNLRAG